MLGIAAIAAAVTQLTGLSGAAAASTGAAPSTGVTAASTQKCTLPVSDAEDSTRCFMVTATLSSPPAVGATASLRVQVRSAVDRTNAEVDIDLPANLVWQDRPAPMTVVEQRSAAAQRTGQLTRASQRRAVHVGEVLAYEGTVRAVAAGPAQILARVSSARPGGVDAAEDHVYLTVGAAGHPSRFGIDVPAEAKAEVLPTNAVPSTEGRPARPFQPVSPAMAARPLSAVTACVSGGMFYVDNWGVTEPSPNALVEVWDRGDFTDGIIATGLTGANGRYLLCFDNDDFGLGTLGMDVYVRIHTQNSRWMVHNQSGTPYSVRRDGPSNVADGSTTELGNLLPPSNVDRAWHAFDEANSSWNFVPHGTANCWDAGDTVCDAQILILWTPTSTLTTRFCPTVNTPKGCTVANQVQLKANEPDGHAVFHEIGHAVMWDVYDHAGPIKTATCGVHTLFGPQSQACAWIEGWADWFALAVTGAHGYMFGDTSFQELEDSSAAAGFPSGDTVEGRIAASMLDLADGVTNGSNPAESRDIYGEGASATYAPILGSVANTFNQFFNQRPASGRTNAALSALFGNTINYGFVP